MFKSKLTEKFDKTVQKEKPSQDTNLENTIGFLFFTFPTLILPLLAAVTYPFTSNDTEALQQPEAEKVVTVDQSASYTCNPQDTHYL
ncbi:hypothetical protein [Paraglaciecola sp.]|uniref:hypothetical protein n=1 Tax=Paraglaciecola sp. TaxID=1920173 RepID=UPI0032641F25